MIDEIDAALRGLLKDEALDGADVEVVFDAPTKDWAARRNAPMVNAYLYDIREDLRKRTRGMINEYNDQGIVVGRRLPPRFYNLSYLVTAWTQRPEDEHRLLAQMLMCFSNYDAMPPERLTGHIGQLGNPVEMRISLPPPEDRSFADVWTALGGELKPSIDVVLSVPLTPARSFPAGPPVEGPPVLTMRDVTGEAIDSQRRKAVVQGEGSAAAGGGQHPGGAGSGAATSDSGAGTGGSPGVGDGSAEGEAGGNAAAAAAAPGAASGAPGGPRARRRRGGMHLDLGEKGGAPGPASDG